MKQGSKLERLGVSAIQAILSAETHTVGHHTLRMTMCLKISRFQRRGQCFQRRSIRVFQRVQGLVKFNRSLLYQLFKMIFIALLGDNQSLMFQSTLHDRFDLAQVKWLHYIVEGSQPKSINCTLHGLHATDHHHHTIGPPTSDMRNHVKAAHAWHGDITDYEFVLSPSQQPKCFLSRASRRAVVLALKEIGQNGRNLCLVINDKNPRSDVT